MVAISFTTFKDKLLSGEKTQTIRRLNIPRLLSMRENGIQIYWKQRTKDAEKLFDAKVVRCVLIAFDDTGLKWEVIHVHDTSSFRELSLEEKIEIARKDGFRNRDEMNQWFFKKYGKSLYEPDILGLQPVFMIIEWERV